MVTILTEKPSVAFDIARVLNINEKKDGHLKNDKFAITWAFGHLVQIEAPTNLSEKWSLDNLPVLPDKFILKCRQKKHKDKSGKIISVDDDGVKKQLGIINSLFNSSDEIIVATDAGREGELIFRYIYNYLNCKKPFKRLWINSLTDAAIKEGFSCLKAGQLYDNLYHAAQARSESDWIVGINATQALTLVAGNKDVLSLGRVQTPTLSIICKRFLENKNFTPETFFTVWASTEKNNTPFELKTEDNFKSIDEAKSVVALIEQKNKIEIMSVERKEVVKTPPLLHDLTSLQKEANRKFSMTPDEVLEIAQKLYESKLITYPRTGSCYISDDVFSTVPELIKKHVTIFSHVSDYFSNATKLTKKSVNSSKVTDHHALLPTEIILTEADFKSMSVKERNVYTLIVGRMLEAFHTNSISENTIIKADCGVTLKTSGSVIKFSGWRDVFINLNSDGDGNDDEEKEKDQKLPKIETGDILPLNEAFFKEEKTKPKPLLTDATLLSYMETCGKEVEDQEAKEAMKDSGLGTPATRAETINILLKREYICRNKKNLIPTEKGLSVYEAIRLKTIGSPEMTGDWEKRIERINRGELKIDDFLTDIKKYAKVLVSELINTVIEIKTKEKPKSKCPKCGLPVKFWEKSAACTGNNKQNPTCDFIVWRNILNKTLTDNQIETLIEGKACLVKGLRSKKDIAFDTKLKLNADFKIEFIFDHPKNSKK